MLTAAPLLSLLSLISCVSAKGAVTVEVSNPAGMEIGPRTVELKSADILGKLGTKGFVVRDGEGREIPSQLTYDSLIVFKAEAGPGETAVYTVDPSDEVREYKNVAWGQEYPKRRDDISYENELIGFRIYGPGTQQAGEKAFGYDIFFKYPTEELIVPQLYAPETDDAVWAKVDSLRAIDPALADDFIKSFSYHIDHGLGMDCYAVGATLGAGVAAIANGDTIYYPWCYDTAEILDNGPVRFTLALNFQPREIEGRSVTEHRLISLDAASHLNATKVWYEGLDAPVEIVAGFPLRDETAPLECLEKGYIAYSDPTQGDANGRALLGITAATPMEKISRRDGHILISRTIAPAEAFRYNWGFAWDRTDIPSLEAWGDYLERSLLDYSVNVK